MFFYYAKHIQKICREDRGNVDHIINRKYGNYVRYMFNGIFFSYF